MCQIRLVCIRVAVSIRAVRVTLTGGTVSPGIFETMEIFGREKTMERLRAEVKRIS